MLHFRSLAAGVTGVLAVAVYGCSHDVTSPGPVPRTSPDISVSITDPMGPFVGDTVAISASVGSQFQLSTVTATLGGKVATLSAASPGVWTGSISLVGTPRDTMTLGVTATDVNGSVTEAVRALTHDRKPHVVVAQPSDSSVARPSVLVDASCDDDGPGGCTLSVRADDGTLLAGPSRSAMHAQVSLAAYDGRGIPIAITAQDSRGQQTSVTRMVWVESSSHLQLIGTADGVVFDADDSRLLWHAGSSVGITHLGAASETIATGMQGTLSLAYLTPSGAAFSISSGSAPYAQLYIWRDGSLTSKSLNSTTSLAAGGDFIIYTAPPNGSLLYQQDVTNGTEVLISNNASNSDNSVIENGDVVYWNSSYDVVRFRAGTNTNITSDGGVGWWNIDPVTDGTNIVFRRNPENVLTRSQAEIWLFDGTALTMLAPSRGYDVGPLFDYKVNSGWIAFTKTDASGFAQVWTRSPSGVLRAVSAFGTSSRIRALGSDGAVVFDNRNDFYYASATGSPVRISASNGTVVWKAGHFIVMLGNAAFTVSP
jgi:hypothetical protein